MVYLEDTNVILGLLKKDPDVKQFVEENDIGVDTTVYIECLQGSKSNREKELISKYLSRFRIYHHTPEMSAKAMALISLYSNTHGLLLPDAQIAATCLVNNLTLLTFNTRDFQFIDGLKRAEIASLVRKIGP